jgi:hypothetical protein
VRNAVYVNIKQINTLAAFRKRHFSKVDVQDWEGERRFAKYSTFKIGDASSKYTLYAEGYSGNAGKS